MEQQNYQTIDRQELEQRLERQKPENEDRSSGYALVNVLGAEEFAKEHIQVSINIPKSRIDEFEDRFDKTKEIIVYCASPDCPASREAAKALTERGFTNVRDYEEGMSDWKQAGNDIEGREAA